MSPHRGTGAVVMLEQAMHTGKPRKLRPASTLIAGAGRLGRRLATELARDQNQVVVIDRRQLMLDRLPPMFPGTCITGDASELETLVTAGIESVEAFVAATDDDSLNIMLAQFAHDWFGVPQVSARVGDPARGEILRDRGVAVIDPTDLAVRAYVQTRRSIA